MDFGILKYGTFNIGDEIQSIAASRFIPKHAYNDVHYIDRENMNNFHSENPIKMISNGWYMHHPKNWPPSTSILPLLISMHITQDKHVLKNIFTERGKEFFRKYGPVGTRDLATLDLFQKHDIPAYFSGCLTLTLPKFNNLEKSDYILAIDISPEMLTFLQAKTDRPIFVVSPCMPFIQYLSQQEKFILAEYMLRLYQEAHCVITSRLHVAMPCLALETPVMLVNNAIDQYRFEGLKQLVRNGREEEYKENYQMFDINDPNPNSTEYLAYREKLIEKCEYFIGSSAREIIDINGNMGGANSNASLMHIICNKKSKFMVRKILNRKISAAFHVEKFKV